MAVLADEMSVGALHDGPGLRDGQADRTPQKLTDPSCRNSDSHPRRTPDDGSRQSGHSRRSGRNKKILENGLVVKEEDSWPRCSGFESHHFRGHFLCTIHSDQSMVLVGRKLTRQCCMCCNTGNGRVDIEEWLAYKNQIHNGKEWIEILSANWDQIS